MSQEHDPRMHTVEHVLNRTMIRMFGCDRSYSTHLEPRKSHADFRFSRPLDEAEFQAVERDVNEILAQNLPVTERLLRVDEAAALMDTSKLPPRIAADPAALIRIVSVGDYDVCPCIGEHAAHTGEAGKICLVSQGFTPAAEPGQPGRLRIRFKLAAS